MQAWRGVLGMTLALCLAAAGCTSDNGDSPARPTPSACGAEQRGRGGPRSPAAPAARRPGLTNPFGCGGGFTCATLRVPLDRTDPARAGLSLLVAMEQDGRAPRGLLVVLAGGPGQAGVPLVERLVETLGDEVVDAYRVAVLDQRGTGATALRCPALQQAMGFSDLTPPPATGRRGCAQAVGDAREFYSTDDVVADLDLLRIAVGVDRMSLFGTSYGTLRRRAVRPRPPAPGAVAGARLGGAARWHRPARRRRDACRTPGAARRLRRDRLPG